MKKTLITLGAIATLSVLFMSCGERIDTAAWSGDPINPFAEAEPEPEPTPSGDNEETVLQTGEIGTFFEWSKFGITADNAADYIVRVTYTLDDESKSGWGPGAFCDKDWQNGSLNEKLNVSSAGVNEIDVSEIIAVTALSNGFMINWWADYATLTKIELIKKVSSSVRRWAKTATSAATDNGDGTCSVTVKSQYSGGGMLVYINEDKSSIESGKTVVVEFDYETVEGKWKDSSLNPAFALSLGKDCTSTYGDGWNAASEARYADGDALKGSKTMEVTATSEANELFLKFNAYEWKGDDKNDELKITIKSVTVK